MPEHPIEDLHKILNLDIGGISDSRRNLYEIGLELLLFERRIHPNFHQHVQESLLRLIDLETDPTLSKKRILYEMMIEFILISHHLKRKYRY